MHEWCQAWNRRYIYTVEFPVIPCGLFSYARMNGITVHVDFLAVDLYL